MQISDYTQAPATRLVATHCCACGRPLLCAESVRTGIGPVCARKYGVSQELRGSVECNQANALVYALAAEQGNWARVTVLLAELRALPNFGMLADKIAKRLTPATQITITIEGNNFKVNAPYNELATPAFRNIPGRRFVKETVKGKEVAFNLIPQGNGQKTRLWNLLQAHYKGLFVKGPTGNVFQVTAA